MMSNDYDYINFLKHERDVLLSRYHPNTEGTGHYNTAVSILNSRIQELEKPKEDKVWVLVEAIGTYRMRYMVEAPAAHPEYALDTVTLEEAKEFSQKWLGETIISDRVVSLEEALELSDIDNDYCSGWSDELKIENFFTKEGEIKDY
jgi:hypothetical protein